jgi:hypothetical protein
MAQMIPVCDVKSESAFLFYVEASQKKSQIFFELKIWAHPMVNSRSYIVYSEDTAKFYRS